MGWNFTSDVEAFAERAGALLAGDPVRNTVPLTVLASLREGRMGERPSADPLLFGWYEQSAAAPVGSEAHTVSGAVLMTPPYELILAALPEGGAGELVDRLRAHGARVPGVNGDVDAVDSFCTAWLDGTDQRPEIFLRTRLYELGSLIPPSPAPRGRARLAVQADADLANDWYVAFHEEVGGHESDLAAAVGDRILDRRMWLWENESREVVSLAARQKTAAGVARTGPVYTPPIHRRRGFAAAVTVACTLDALEQAGRVVLFTDLANPTSNSIYQQIGFRPITDRLVVRFPRGPESLPGTRGELPGAARPHK